MRPITTTIQPQPQRPIRPVAQSPRPPVVIRPFTAPVVRELPPRRVAAGAAW